MDQPDGFAGNDGGDIEIAGRLRRGIVGCDRSARLHQLDLAARPAPHMVVDQAAPGEWRRPHIVARQSNTMPRTLLPLFAARMSCFASSAPSPPCWHRSACPSARRTPPASASQPARARRQCRRQRQPARGQPPDRRSPARYRSWSARRRGRPLRFLVQSKCRRRHRAPAAPSPRFCTWQISNAPAALMLRRERRGIAERQHDGARFGVERDVQQVRLLRQTPGDEADAERLGASFSFAVSASSRARHHSHRPGCRSRRPHSPPGSAGARNGVHRRQQDRMSDAQKCRQIRRIGMFAPSSGQQS